MQGPGWAALAALAVAAPASAADGSPQAALDQLADSLGYRFEVVDNRPQCPAQLDPCFLSTITLTVPQTLPAGLPAKNLALYFSFVRPLPRVESDLFEHHFVNGDLQRLTFKPGATLRPGTTHTIRLWGTGAAYARAFAMPNAYLAADGLKARTIAATRPRIDFETGLEVLPFVAPMTNEAKLAAKSDSDKTRWLTAERAFALQAGREAPATTGVAILPKPVTAVQGERATVDLRSGVAMSLSGVERQAIAPALAALAGTGVTESGKLPLSIRIDPASAIAPKATSST